MKSVIFNILVLFLIYFENYTRADCIGQETGIDPADKTVVEFVLNADRVLQKMPRETFLSARKPIPVHLKKIEGKTYKDLETPLAKYFHNKYPGKFHKYERYLDFDRKTKCKRGFVWLKSFDDIGGYISDFSFDPDCIWSSVTKAGAPYAHDKLREKIVGITFGINIGALILTSGTELVLIPLDGDTVMVGMIRYDGGGLAKSPINLGGGFTQSVIHGECKNGIPSYLGWFKTKSFVGTTKSTGIINAFTDKQKKTNCNSHSYTRGSTMALLGAGRLHYEQVGKFMLVTGPRVIKLINLINRLNRKKKTDH